MGKVVCALTTSHNPSLMVPPERWGTIYEKLTSRRLLDTSTRPPALEETLEINNQQYQQCMNAFARLKRILAECRPDVVVIFGDDQHENFHTDNMPSFCVFRGKSFYGYPFKALKSYFGESPGERLIIQGHSRFATCLLERAVELGFDLAFSEEMPDRQWGLPHSHIRVLHHVLPSFDIPVVPVHVNSLRAPCPTPGRCYDLGRALARIVTEDTPEEFRVAVIGSGGLSHSPNTPKAGVINEQHDRWVIDCFREGDACKLARLTSQDLTEALDVELRNWIVVAGTIDGARPIFTEYVPAYRTVVGMAFAAWGLDP